MTARLRYRKFVSGFMLGMTGLAAFITVAVLFFILGYLVYHGGTSINWNFFTKLPTPVGEDGGGMANAIVGSAKLLLLASIIGVPVGFLGGRVSCRIQRRHHRLHRALRRRLAERRALHRHRNLCLRPGGAALQTLFDRRRLFRASADDDPHHAAQHRTIPASRARLRCAKAPWPWAPANGKPSPP